MINIPLNDNTENKTRKPLLCVRNLRGGYGTLSGYFRAIDNVNLDLYPREILGIVGESGSGKSTLLKLIAGGKCISPLLLEGGNIVIENIDLASLPCDELRRCVKEKKIIYVPQSAFDALYPYKRIWSFYVDLLKEYYGEKIDKRFEEQEKINLAGYFEVVGLDSTLLNKYPFELSGGMRQRVVITIASSLKPSVILLDEPTSALDVVTQKKVLQMIADIFAKEHVKSVIISSHDIATLKQIVHRLYVMYCGKIVEFADSNSIIQSPLHPYTTMLIESLKVFEESKQEKRGKVLYRDLAVEYSAYAMNRCRFYPRCPYSSPICEKEEPPLIEVGTDHWVSCWLYIKR
ncbi:MAG: ABC transporter ATP-binding protein [Ignisphaera sp.]|uniref:ABC transporter ATP-binding protein n=1 Tax=Ignisphaera aggregans TaxID=334771 RepID=A0A7C4JJJ7_9CREN